MYLYQIRNKNNGRKYYGITDNLSRRWSQHKNTAGKNNRPLYKAMAEEGIATFTLEMLCEGDAAYIIDKEIQMIASDPDCYNLHQGGHIGFDVTTKNAADVAEWKAKLREKRKGRTPSKGMQHSAETKKVCGDYSKQRWDLCGRYPSDVTSLNFKEAKEKYGISKTHYYRLSRRSSNDAA